MAGLAAAVDSARYWQEPDETDELLLRPSVSRAALRPVATALAQAPWRPCCSPDTVALDRHRFVQWTDERRTATSKPHRCRPESWPDGKPQPLADERQAADRPRDPAAHLERTVVVNTGTCLTWSTTTRSLPGLGASKTHACRRQYRLEERPGLAACTGRRLPDLRNTGPHGVDGLVARYPLDVSLSKRHDWWRTTGVDGPWLDARLVSGCRRIRRRAPDCPWLPHHRGTISRRRPVRHSAGRMES